MTKTPFFSAVTASLNKADTLRHTIESIRNQIFPSYEHIVVDGGSHDETITILKEYSDQYDLRWTSEPDDGISSALNKAIGTARGQYIIVIQADDQLLNPKVLENVYNLLNDERYDIYSFPVVVTHKDSRRTTYRPRRFTLFRYHFKNIFPHQGTFVHRRTFDKTGLFREDLPICMDYDFFYRCMKSGCSFKKGAIPVAIWDSGGISHTQAYKRIFLEMRVQDLNETQFLWRTAQLLFRTMYLPYRKILSKISDLDNGSAT